MQVSQQPLPNPQFNNNPNPMTKAPPINILPQDPRILRRPVSSSPTQSIPIISQANPTITRQPIFQNIQQQNFINNQASRNVIISQAGPTRTASLNKSPIYNQRISTSSEKSSTRIQYIPYQKTVVDYEIKQVYTSMWVPIQKKCLNYYAIQNITQYIPRQVEDIRYETVPQQQIQYKVQYIPIQRRMIHLPQSQEQLNRQRRAALLNINKYDNGIVGGQYVDLELAQLGISNAGAFKSFTQTQIPGYKPLQNRGISRTNYVTTDGYVPISMRPPEPIPILPPNFNPNSSNIKNLGANPLANQDLLQGIRNSLAQKNPLLNQNLAQGIRNSFSNPNQNSNQNLIQGNRNSSSSQNPIENQDLFQGIRNSLGMNQNQSNGPSFMNDNAFMQGIVIGIKNSNKNTQLRSSNSNEFGAKQLGLKKSDSFNFIDINKKSSQDRYFDEEDQFDYSK